MDGMKGTITSTSAEPVSEMISQEVIKYLVQVADRAEKTGGRIAEQLQEVCMPQPPTPEDAEEKKSEVCTATREYPHYFDILRQRLQCIESALERINDVLDRCEV